MGESARMMSPEVSTLKDLITVAVLCLSPSAAWLTLCFNWYTKFDEIRASRRRTLASVGEEINHIQLWTGAGYDDATSTRDWYNPTFGILDFPSEKIHEFNAVPEPEQFGPEIVDAVVALEASIDRFRAFVRRAQDWASSVTPDTKRNVMDTMEFEPAGAFGWRVREFKANAVEALSVSDRQWLQELYRRNRDTHVEGIGNAEKPEGLFANISSAASRLEIANERLERPIRPKRFWIGHIVALVLGLIGILFLGLFFYVGIAAAAKSKARGLARPQPTQQSPDSLKAPDSLRLPVAVPLERTRRDTASNVGPTAPPPEHAASWTTGLTFGQHVYLVLLAALLGLVFTGVQKAAAYEIDRNRRHHRAIAQLEYIFGRRFHRLAQNVARAEALRDAIRQRALGSMFPALFEPDDSPCIELFNAGLINAVLRVNERMEVLDFNLGALRAAYEKVRDDFKSNPTSAPMRETYERNAGPMADQYESLRKEMLEMRKELIRVLAWLKILGKRDKPGIRRFLMGKSRKSARVTDYDVEDTIREIERLASAPQYAKRYLGDP